MSDEPAKYRSEINISVEISSEAIDRQSLQHALYKAGSGLATAMYDYLTAELAGELGEEGQDYTVSIKRIVRD